MNTEYRLTADEKAEISSYDIGVSIGRWGPACWGTLNALAFGAHCDVDRFTAAAEALAHLLPCNMCREHFKAHLRTTPPPRESPEDAQRWLVAFHNAVSARSSVAQMSFAEVQAEQARTEPAKACADLWGFLLAMAVVYADTEQRAHVRAFVDELVHIFPVRTAAEALRAHPPDLHSTSTLFGSVLTARNAWARDVQEEEWTLAEAVQHFAPPTMYTVLGVTDAGDRAVLDQMWTIRSAAVRNVYSRASDRMNANNKGGSRTLHGVGLKSEAGVWSEPPGVKTWTTTQLAGLTLLVLMAFLVLGLAIASAMTLSRKRSRQSN